MSWRSPTKGKGSGRKFWRRSATRRGASWALGCGACNIACVSSAASWKCGREEKERWCVPRSPGTGLDKRRERGRASFRRRCIAARSEEITDEALIYALVGKRGGAK